MQIDLSQYGQTPVDLGSPSRFDKVFLPITRLFEAQVAAGKGSRLKDLTFSDCLISGPGVLIPDLTTLFDACNLGDVKGDVRNLFLVAAGPGIIGGIGLENCRFERCFFRGVGFTGNQHYVDAMVKSLRDGQA